MNQYRKLIVAVIGLAALFVKRHYGIDLDGTEDQIADAVISALTAYLVWRAPNAQPEGEKCPQCSSS